MTAVVHFWSMIWHFFFCLIFGGKGWKRMDPSHKHTKSNNRNNMKQPIDIAGHVQHILHCPWTSGQCWWISFGGSVPTKRTTWNSGPLQVENGIKKLTVKTLWLHILKGKYHGKTKTTPFFSCWILFFSAQCVIWNDFYIYIYFFFIWRPGDLW